jgi:hypothetical protein
VGKKVAGAAEAFAPHDDFAASHEVALERLARRRS